MNSISAVLFEVYRNGMSMVITLQLQLHYSFAIVWLLIDDNVYSFSVREQKHFNQKSHFILEKTRTRAIEAQSVKNGKPNKLKVFQIDQLIPFKCIVFRTNANPFNNSL
jgi:hypothetical protein